MHKFPLLKILAIAIGAGVLLMLSIPASSAQTSMRGFEQHARGSWGRLDA